MSATAAALDSGRWRTVDPPHRRALDSTDVPIYLRLSPETAVQPFSNWEVTR
jgi:hypothetical protein